MSPRFEPDFTTVQVATPTYPKGTYELSIDGVSGGAWEKSNEKTGESYVVQRVRCRATMRGVYDSKGKLSDTHDEMGEIEGKDVRPIDLYIHSEGAQRMAKQQMMAILGFNPREEEDEAAFNEWVGENGVDFGYDYEPSEDGTYQVSLGDGWMNLEGRNVIAMLDIEMYDSGDGDPTKQQRVVSLLPVGAI